LRPTRYRRFSQTWGCYPYYTGVRSCQSRTGGALRLGNDRGSVACSGPEIMFWALQMVPRSPGSAGCSIGLRGPASRPKMAVFGLEFLNLTRSNPGEAGFDGFSGGRSSGE